MNFQQLAEEVPKWYHFSVYQSVWFNGQEIIKGGRDNMFPRMEKIRLEDIKDKTVVDIGCNLGAASFWSIENGAKSCIGVDVAKEGIELANKIAEELKVNCKFKVGSFDDNQEKMGDVAFCFACHDDIAKEDLKRQQVLLDNLKKYDVIYFETHLKNSFDNWDMPQLIKDNFKCEYLGETGDKILKRDFYRLT
ncbi:MAG: class I SAM-dependent methyltransferase [Erysipelotrichaceae bacterium]|nr:class I SAM-dependent methyltransferase [Erysipelotrichaceae bacterium]